MEYEHEIKGILVTFYRNGRDGDYMEALTKAIYEIGRISEKNFCKPAVRQSLPSDVYTELDIDKAYKCGEQQSTFYKKNGTVILPRNYEGIDG